MPYLAILLILFVYGSAMAQPTEPTNSVFNALTATNLEQWKQAVKDLKQLDSSQYHQDWIMEVDNPNRSPNRNSGRSFSFILNGQAMEYKATVIYITTWGESETLKEVQLQTPNMNIEETRKLGTQLCKMLGQDPADFLSWCDKVGNKSLDAPVFGTKGNRQLGFHTLTTYNNTEPWCIEFVIQNPRQNGS